MGFAVCKHSVILKNVRINVLGGLACWEGAGCCEELEGRGGDRFLDGANWGGGYLVGRGGLQPWIRGRLGDWF